MNDVPMTGEAAQEVPHTLDQCIELGVDEHLRDQVLTRILDQPLSIAHLLPLQGLHRDRVQLLLQIDVTIDFVPRQQSYGKRGIKLGT